METPMISVSTSNGRLVARNFLTADFRSAAPNRLYCLLWSATPVLSGARATMSRPNCACPRSPYSCAWRKPSTSRITRHWRRSKSSQERAPNGRRSSFPMTGAGVRVDGVPFSGDASVRLCHSAIRLTSTSTARGVSRPLGYPAQHPLGGYATAHQINSLRVVPSALLLHRQSMYIGG